MVRQPLLLLADVELLDIVDQLLLQTVAVVIHTRYLLQTFYDALTDLLHTPRLVRLDLCQQLLDVVNLLLELLLEGGTLLDTEVHEVLQRFSHSLAHHLPLCLVEHLRLRLRQHVGHPEKRVEAVLRHGDARLLRDALDLLVVVLHESRIDGCGVYGHVLLYPHTHVNLSSYKGLGHHLAHLHLLLTIERCDAGVQVELLRVERLHLYVYFLLSKGHDSIAVACH